MIQLIDLDQINLDEKNLREQRERETEKEKESERMREKEREKEAFHSFAKKVPFLFAKMLNVL